MNSVTTNANNKTADRGNPVVVLGGAGFIGSHVCRALVARGMAVRIFDKVHAARGLIRDLESDVEIIEGSVTRPEDVLDVIRDCETVINLVHTTVPGSSMRDPAHDVQSNVVAAVQWLSRLDETAVRKIVFVSSGGTVYGLPQTDLIDEGHPTNPISSYGVTKLAIEKYVALYASRCGVRHLILRPSNVYGEGQQLQIGQGVIGVLAERALSGQPLEVWGAGTARRDYLYVSDLVSAMMSLLEYEGPHNVFNVASGEGQSVLDIIDVLRRHLGQLPEITHAPSRDFDVPVNVLDNARLRAATGWRSTVSLDDGIARVIRWLREPRSAVMTAREG